MRRVLVETPFAGDRDRHLGYLRRCLRDCLARGEAPFASHAIYPQVLSDADPVERNLGIEAGFAWGELAHATVVYTDFGISDGMKLGIDHAKRNGREIEYRTIKRAAIQDGTS
jgi:hypothetical protein